MISPRPESVVAAIERDASRIASSASPQTPKDHKMADKLEIYTKSTKAWFKDPEDGYVVASLVERIVDEKNVILKFKVDATSAVCQAEFSSKYFLLIYWAFVIRCLFCY